MKSGTCNLTFGRQSKTICGTDATTDFNNSKEDKEKIIQNIIQTIFYSLKGQYCALK